MYKKQIYKLYAHLISYSGHDKLMKTVYNPIVKSLYEIAILCCIYWKCCFFIYLLVKWIISNQFWCCPLSSVTFFIAVKQWYSFCNSYSSQLLFTIYVKVMCHFGIVIPALKQMCNEAKKFVVCLLINLIVGKYVQQRQSQC